MTPRLPIRVRLTAAFSAVMALALAGAGAGAVLDFGRTLDAAVDARLTARADDLAAPDGAAARLADDADSVAQRISVDGHVVAASPHAGAAPLLDPGELARARRHPLHLDREHVPGVPGRARVLATGGSGDPVVVVATSLAGRDAALADIRTELAVAFPLVLLVATAAAYLLATAALRPVERMRARAAAITADTPGPRLPVPPGRDEISRLGATLNDMLDRLHTALTRERDFVADASHELRTPLALLKTELELALHRPRSPAEVDNALRHGGGSIDVTADQDGTYRTVRVRDHGTGFPPDFLPTAFDRFTRADAARTGPGTGLGLAIVAAIVRWHGGTAHARNHPDGGAGG